MSSIALNPNANAATTATTATRATKAPFQLDDQSDRIISDTRLSAEVAAKEAKLKADHIPVAMAEAGMSVAGQPALIVPSLAITHKSTEETIGKLQSINYGSPLLNEEDMTQIVQNLITMVGTGRADEIRKNLQLLTESEDSNQLTRAHEALLSSTDGASLATTLNDIVTEPTLTAGIPRDTNKMVEAFSKLITTFLELSITSAKMKSYSRTLNLEMAFHSADKIRDEGKTGLIGAIVGGVVATTVAVGSAAYTVKGIADEHGAGKKLPGLREANGGLEKERDALAKTWETSDNELKQMKMCDDPDQYYQKSYDTNLKNDKVKAKEQEIKDLNKNIADAEAAETKGKQAQVWGQVGTHTLGQVILGGQQGITGNETAKIRAEGAELRASSETHGARSQEQNKDQDNLNGIVSKLIEILSQFNSTEQSARDTISTKV